MPRWKRRMDLICAGFFIVIGGVCAFLYWRNARVDALVDALGHRDAGVRHEAVAGLLDTGGPLVIERLIETVEAADERVTRKSLYAEAVLMAMGREAFEYLFADCLTPPPGGAFRLPRCFGGARPTPRRRTTVDRLLRVRVLPSLEDGGLAALASKLDSADNVTLGMVASLLPRRPEAGELLAPFASSGDEMLRQTLLERIGYCRAFDAAPAILPLLEDPAGDVRRTAAGVLGDLGNPISVEPLCAALADRELARHAAGALGRIGDPRAADALLAVLEDKDHYDAAREAAAAALGEIGCRRAIGTLIAFLPESMDESHRGLPQAAAVALGRLGGPEAIEALSRALSARTPATNSAPSAAAKPRASSGSSRPGTFAYSGNRIRSC